MDTRNRTTLTEYRPADAPAALPASIDAEQALLGSVLLNRQAMIPIAPWFRAEFLYDERHRQIYLAMLACYNARIPPDTRVVAERLRQAGVLEQIGGVPYLSDLVSGVPTSYHVEHYARIVEQAAVRRALIRAGARITALGLDETRPVETAVADAFALLRPVTLASADEIFQPLATTIDAYYAKIERVQNGEASALGLPSGFRDLDALTGGLHGDELTIVAARPAVGKTSFLLSMAYNLAQRGEADVLICSLEMSRDQLLTRLLAMETRIDTHRLRTLRLDEGELDRVMTAMGVLAAARVYIADLSAMTAEQIRLAVLRHISQHERPAVPMVDYLQLMGSTRQRENRVQDVSDISRGLKQLTRELHAPVIALSQLSRAVESRQNHRPILSDLRESGSLEQDADNVWMLYRDELYDGETDQKGIAELNIAKHRNGPIGVVPMRFDPMTTRFDDLTYRTPEGY
jgi:replicative DNA helicase